MGRTREAPPARDFESWGKHLRWVYFSARKRTVLRPRDDPINALKDALYAYFYELKEFDLLDQLEQFVIDTQDPWKGPRPGAVTWVVRLIEIGDEWLLDNSARNRMVADLMLADFNNIRPEMLLAFIYEAGPIGVRKDALANGECFDWAERYRYLNED